MGFIARLFGRALYFMPGVLFGAAAKQAEPAETPGGYVIAIGRQYGAGGRVIGKQLAEKLGYAFYDEEILQMAAGTTGYTPQFVSRQEESMGNSLLYDLVNQMYAYAPEQESPKDAVFEAEKKTILELAQKGNCVLVGRCADWLLRKDPHCLRVWLHADEESRLRRIMDIEGVNECTARLHMTQGDRRRATNYQYYTRQVWGLAKNFHIAVDTTLGDDYALETILQALKALKGRQEANV